MDDFALDCIANLFARDDRDSFREINRYFGSLDMQTLGDEELLALTRRLVFSAVNAQIFRSYRASDPTLAKIIRNLKSALKFSESLRLERVGGELCIFPNLVSEEISSASFMTPEFFEGRLVAQLDPNAGIKEVLLVVSNIFAEESSHQPSFPLIGLALIIRSSLLQLYDAPAEAYYTADVLSDSEIESIILQSIVDVRERMRASYLKAGKLNAPAYESLFLAINDILVAQFIQDNGFDLSFYDYLKRYLPDLTLIDYQHRFRVYLEYLTKLTRVELLTVVKKEMQ